jgi:aarF domain-containing kinase
MSPSRFPLLIKRAAQATGATLATGGVGYTTYLYETDDGFHRMCQAYSTFVPVVTHYRFAEFRHKHVSPLTNADWEAMDEQYAVPTVTSLGRLQGMYTKYGQTAAGFTNTFSDVWIREFRKLENEVPPRPIESVRRTIEEETGKPVEETFSFLEEQPLGSASIGQVHRATLKDGGRQVAVKVQYPEAQALFHEDIDTIRRFCEIFAPEHIVILDALEKQNATELDYQNEAKNLQEVQSNMIRYGFQPREVVVPSPLPEFSTKRLLVMELLPGPKLINGIRTYFDAWARAHGTTLHDLEQAARDRIEREGVPAKYDGPSAWKMASYRTWLRTKDVVCNLGIGGFNTTLGTMTGRSLPYHHSVLPPNIPRIIDTLMRVHGIQLLKFGVFNSDPHGGNFLLLPDSRIGLIDYGATKRLSRNERLSACLLFAALHRKDEEMLFQMCDMGGYKSKYGRRDVLLKLIQFGYDSYGKDVTGGKNIQQFLDELKEKDPWEEVPDNFVMAQVRFYCGWLIEIVVLWSDGVVMKL